MYGGFGVKRGQLFSATVWCCTQTAAVGEQTLRAKSWAWISAASTSPVIYWYYSFASMVGVGRYRYWRIN